MSYFQKPRGLWDIILSQTADWVFQKKKSGQNRKIRQFSYWKKEATGNNFPGIENRFLLIAFYLADQIKQHAETKSFLRVNQNIYLDSLATTYYAVNIFKQGLLF